MVAKTADSIRSRIGHKPEDRQESPAPARAQRHGGEKICKKLRQQRAHAVQSLVQYIFLHAALAEIALEEKLIKEDKEVVVKFVDEYKKHMEKLISKLKKKESMQKPVLQVIGLDLRQAESENPRTEMEARKPVDDKTQPPNFVKGADELKE
uniref:Tyrosine-protein phosphatase domain-containing protein n=1 Tax=Bursaphelenchus xylophilus TaxID=6326 RepID=A0A1I7RSN8_BURXY